MQHSTLSSSSKVAGLCKHYIFIFLCKLEFFICKKNRDPHEWCDWTSVNTILNTSHRTFTKYGGEPSCQYHIWKKKTIWIFFSLFFSYLISDRHTKVSNLEQEPFLASVVKNIFFSNQEFVYAWAFIQNRIVTKCYRWFQVKYELDKIPAQSLFLSLYKENKYVLDAKRTII